MYNLIEPSDSKQASVLVIDNDRSILRLISMHLEHGGYQCHLAHSGEEALVMFFQHRIDAVVTDLDMPGIDGFGLIGMIRHQSSIPIVVISGYITKYRDLIAKFDPINFLSKPFDSEQLMKIIKSSLATTAPSRNWYYT